MAARVRNKRVAQISARADLLSGGVISARHNINKRDVDKARDAILISAMLIKRATQ